MGKWKITARFIINDRRLLRLEILIGIFSIIILLGFTFVASFVEMEAWIRIILIISGFIPALIGIAFALKIEQIAGYYECKKCGHKYILTYKSVFLAMHMNRIALNVAKNLVIKR